jgi:CPA2 family monovalent cation:H+ antiporter-2
VAPKPPEPELPVTTLRDHAVLVGYGRVGSLIGDALRERGTPYLVVEEKQSLVDKLRVDGIEVLLGNAGQRGLLEAANLGEARWLVSAIPNPFEASSLIEAARSANPSLRIIARAHSDAEVDHLQKFGADNIVLGEREIAREMARFLEPRDVLPPGLGSDEDAFAEARRVEDNASGVESAEGAVLGESMDSSEHISPSADVDHRRCA